MAHPHRALSHWYSVTWDANREGRVRAIHPCTQGKLTVVLQDQFKHPGVGCRGFHSSERTNSMLPNTPITGILLQDRTWQVQVEILEGSCAVWLCWTWDLRCSLPSSWSLQDRAQGHEPQLIPELILHLVCGKGTWGRYVPGQETTEHRSKIEDAAASGKGFHLLLVLFPLFGNTGLYLTQML